MSRAWMPLYVGDFLADTMHLNATETGIYLRLIMHCWQHGTIPRDDRKLAMIGHCDTRLWHQYRETVLRFFDVVDASTMQHKRVSTELLRSEEISNKRKAAALQKQSKSTAIVVQLHPQSQSQSPSLKKEEESCPVGKPTRIAYSAEFESKFWQPYPRSPTMSKLDAWKAWQKLSPELRDAACRAVAPYKQLMAAKPEFIVHACRFLSQRRFEGVLDPSIATATLMSDRRVDPRL